MSDRKPVHFDGDEVAYVSGRTRLYGIVGHPIEQVRSPEMVTAEFQRRGRDAILVPLHVAPEEFDSCLPQLLKIRNLGGLIFTIPYKARACTLAGRLGNQARVVGAINALTRDRNGGWIADIFDGAGCVEAFRQREISFAGQRVMLIGAGGAGSAIGVAVAFEGPASMRVFDIDSTRAIALAERIRGVNSSIVVDIGAPIVDGIDILLNASPVGMLDDPRTPIEAARIPSRIVVFDAIVKPETTKLIALAESCGCRIVAGREMMRGQIARMVNFFEAGNLD